MGLARPTGPLLPLTATSTGEGAPLLRRPSPKIAAELHPLSRPFRVGRQIRKPLSWPVAQRRNPSRWVGRQIRKPLSWPVLERLNLNRWGGRRICKRLCWGRQAHPSACNHSLDFPRFPLATSQYCPHPTCPTSVLELRARPSLLTIPSSTLFWSGYNRVPRHLPLLRLRKPTSTRQ